MYHFPVRSKCHCNERKLLAAVMMFRFDSPVPTLSLALLPELTKKIHLLEKVFVNQFCNFCRVEFLLCVCKSEDFTLAWNSKHWITTAIHSKGNFSMPCILLKCTISEPWWVKCRLSDCINHETLLLQQPGKTKKLYLFKDTKPQHYVHNCPHDSTNTINFEPSQPINIGFI